VAHVHLHLAARSLAAARTLELLHALRDLFG
jgi:hypothetical protein